MAGRIFLQLLPGSLCERAFQSLVQQVKILLGGARCWQVNAIARGVGIINGELEPKRTFDSLDCTSRKVAGFSRIGGYDRDIDKLPGTCHDFALLGGGETNDVRA